MALLCSNLAAYSLANGDVEFASSAAREALRLALDIGRILYVPWSAMLHIAACAQHRGHHESAARLLGYARTRLEHDGRPIEFTERSEFDLTRAALVEALGQERFDQLYAAGTSQSEETAIAEAFAV